MEQLFSAPYLNILFEDGILICQWKGQQTAEEVRHAGNFILSVVKERRIARVLIDNTHVLGSWHDVTEWTAQIWFPAMVDAGTKWFAWILSDDIFAASSARRAKPPGLHMIRIFGSYHEAYKWLSNHQQSM